MSTSDEHDVIEEITEQGKRSTDPARDAGRRDGRRDESEQSGEPGKSATDAPKD
jgi:hypothetical protein